MKKDIIFSLIISIVINIICLIVNLISAVFFETLPLSIIFWGGEISNRIGFGISLTKFYPLSVYGEEINVSNQINFDIFSITISFIIIFAIVLIIRRLIKKRRKKD